MVKYLAQGHTANGEHGRAAGLPSSLVLCPTEAEGAGKNGAGAASRASGLRGRFSLLLGDRLSSGRQMGAPRQGGFTHLQEPLGSQPRLKRQESSPAPHAGGQCAPFLSPAPGSAKASSACLLSPWGAPEGGKEALRMRFSAHSRTHALLPPSVSSSGSRSHAFLFQY